jgi:hypothetical protein
MADAVIPRFRAERAVVPGTYDPLRRPGSSGQRYFSDMQYANPNMPSVFSIQKQRVTKPKRHTMSVLTLLWTTLLTLHVQLTQHK